VANLALYISLAYSKDRGIKVTFLAPGGTKTNIATPKHKGYLEPSAIADAIVYIAENSAKNVWVRDLVVLPLGFLVGWLDSEKVEAKTFQPGFSRSDLQVAPTRALAQECEAGDPAHILFTSGSTGTPKGVVITHSNVMAFVSWALEHFGIDYTDRFSGHTPFHFDLSTFDIFGAFAAGAELHLVPPGVALLPPQAGRIHP